jgi:hypothetical protein
LREAAKTVFLCDSISFQIGKEAEPFEDDLREADVKLPMSWLRRQTHYMLDVIQDMLERLTATAGQPRMRTCWVVDRRGPTNAEESINRGIYIQGP